MALVYQGGYETEMILLLKSCILLLAGCISATFYRAGGMSVAPDTQPKRIPVWLRHSWVRDWLIPFVTMLTLMLFKCPQINWTTFICVYGLMGGALSLYWDIIFKKDNFYFSGFMIGLSFLPFWFFGMNIWLILARAIILGISMGLINKYVNKYMTKYQDLAEELSRGFLIVITLAIFLYK